MQQTLDPLTNIIHGFCYHSKTDCKAWTVTNDRTYHNIGGYGIPKDCNTKTVMNRLKKCELQPVDHYVFTGAHFTP